NKVVKRDFVLAGWWDSYPGVPMGTIIASKTYVDTHVEELKSTYKNDKVETGTITGIIKFSSTKNLNEDLETVIRDSGFSMDSDAQNYINAGVNPLYSSKSTLLGKGTIIAILSFTLLFIFTGYLIIYNIFQISVLKDMNYYGLLKSIGTTKKQLHSIIIKQALILSCIGIPVGLCVGFFLSKLLLPSLAKNLKFYQGVGIETPNPIIFVIATIFSLITIFISVRKPAKMAEKVSPIEAISYNEIDLVKTNKKKSVCKGTPQSRMAWSSLWRNKKRTILVILSLSLSVILANTIFEFSQSINPEEALKNIASSDFRIGSTDLFYNYKINAKSALSEDFIKEIQKQDGFEAGGSEYGCKAAYTSKTTKQQNNGNKDGSFNTILYGLDEFPFSKLELVDGQIDKEKLQTGKYILEGVWVNSRGVMDTNSINHSIGDKIKLNVNGKIQEVTVLAHVVANESNTYDWGDSCFFTLCNPYKKFTGNLYIMSYSFDVSQDNENDMENFLKQYTNNIEPTMSYKSKLTIIDGVMNMRNMVLVIGGTIAFIIGVIGVINFINTILTNIYMHRRELAVLQSIGMTRKQSVKMFCLEGSYYTILTAITSIALSIVSSLFIVKPLCKKIWFLSFKFDFRIIIILLLILFVISLLIPYVVYKIINKQSVTERLKIN
ncbi:MAG: ABC transporter permease, partial [Clostridiaceae bacterium]|nr:ABC transporter permease [Clostridiaceae bacterium]